MLKNVKIANFGNLIFFRCMDSMEHFCCIDFMEILCCMDVHFLIGSLQIVKQNPESVVQKMVEL